MWLSRFHSTDPRDSFSDHPPSPEIDSTLDTGGPRVALMTATHDAQARSRREGTARLSCTCFGRSQVGALSRELGVKGTSHRRLALRPPRWHQRSLLPRSIGGVVRRPSRQIDEPRSGATWPLEDLQGNFS